MGEGLSAENQVQRARIQALADRWLKPLGLLWWRVEFFYNEDRLDFIAEGGGDGVRRETLMRVHADWRYLQASVEVNVSYLGEFEDEELEGFFVHELMHVHLAELSVDDDCFKAHEERVATCLSNAFRWVRDYAVDGELPKVEGRVSG